MAWTIQSLYLDHYAALEKSRLTPKIAPTLQQIWKLDKEQQKKKDENDADPEKARKRIKDAKRNVYFVIAFSKFWAKYPLHRTIQRLSNIHGLKWLRTRMAYSRYTNLREGFQGIISTKLNENLVSLDFLKKPCDCRPCTKRHGFCAYNNQCKVPCVVYKATCLKTGAVYIGNTQQFFKERMNGHYQDVRSLVRHNVLSDSFARSFARHFKPKSQIKADEVRKLVNMRVLWEGNPVTLSKSFAKSTCRLCMKERMTIFAMSRDKNVCLINSFSEIYGACRHKPKFHRFSKQH